MGVKGRDIALWVLLITLPIVFIFLWLNSFTLVRVICLLTLISGGYLLVFQYITVLKALRFSRENNLQMIVLIPISQWWANIISKKEGLIGKYHQAYEFHIVNAKKERRMFMETLNDDLKKIAAMEDLKYTLFIWETNAPFPSAIRMLIRQNILNNKAFWRKGGYLIPAPPLVARQLKKGVVRHGAFIWEGENNGWITEKKG